MMATLDLSRCFVAEQDAGVIKRMPRSVAVVACLLAVAAIVSTFRDELRQIISESRQPDVSSRAETSRKESADQAMVKLSADQQKQIDLETMVLTTASHPEQFRAYGTVTASGFVRRRIDRLSAIWMRNCPASPGTCCR